MTTELNGEHGKTFIYKTKIPIDVRIVSIFLYAIGFFQLACSCLLITGRARLGKSNICFSISLHLLQSCLSQSLYFAWDLYIYYAHGD